MKSKLPMWLLFLTLTACGGSSSSKPNIPWSNGSVVTSFQATFFSNGNPTDVDTFTFDYEVTSLEAASATLGDEFINSLSQEQLEELITSERDGQIAIRRNSDDPDDEKVLRFDNLWRPIPSFSSEDDTVSYSANNALDKISGTALAILIPGELTLNVTASTNDGPTEYMSTFSTDFLDVERFIRTNSSIEYFNDRIEQITLIETDAADGTSGTDQRTISKVNNLIYSMSTVSDSGNTQRVDYEYDLNENLVQVNGYKVENGTDTPEYTIDLTYTASETALPNLGIWYMDNLVFESVISSYFGHFSLVPVFDSFL